MSRFNSILNQTTSPFAPTTPQGAIVGTEYSDFLVGSSGNDKIVGREGTDFLFGDGPLVTDPYYGNYVGFQVQSGDTVTLGNDSIVGGPGPNDFLAYDGAFDYRYFGSFMSGDVEYASAAEGATINFGNDKIVGSGCNDLVYGDLMSDYDLVSYGGGGTYNFGSDTIDTGAGDDSISGDASLLGNYPPLNSTYNMGNDVLKAGEGDDILIGDVSEVYSGSATFGNDNLQGGNGADFLIGDAFYVAGYSDQTSVYVLGSDTLDGGAGDDGIVGDIVFSQGDVSISGGNDLINGGAGNDSLLGSYGNDTITGGSGIDGFYFYAPLDAATNVDTITDFAAKTERMFLLEDIFTALPTGTLSQAAFALTTGTTTTDTRIIYNAQTGAVYYDADGSDAAYSAVQFATLLGRPNISETNFVVI